MNNPFGEFWIGVVDALRAEYLGDDTPTVFNAKDKPMPNSKAGRSLLLSLSHDRFIKPFQNSEELFQTGPQGAHDIMQKALSSLSRHKTWEALFTNLSKLKSRLVEENALVEMGLRLAKTQPKHIPGWVQDELKSSTIADRWVRAQKVYGSLWHSAIKVSFGDQSTSTELTSAIKAPKYSAVTAVKDTATHNAIEELPTLLSPVTQAPLTSFYKARTRVAPKTKNKPGKKTKYKTYLKISLPISSTLKESYDEVQKEVFRVLHVVWEALLSIDSRNVFILSWKDNEDIKYAPLKQGDTLLANRYAIEQKYVKQWKIGWHSDSTELRFRLGDDKELDQYLDNSRVCNVMDEAMGTLVRDKLQTSETVLAVWFGDPIPEESTRELIEDIILESPIFQKHGITNLELQNLPIRTKNGAVPKGAKRVKAIHAICSKDNSDKVRDILKQMYLSKPRKDYPKGVQWRAIENTADPNFQCPHGPE
jgi:hypothetical protein